MNATLITLAALSFVNALIVRMSKKLSMKKKEKKFTKKQKEKKEKRVATIFPLSSLIKIKKK